MTCDTTEGPADTSVVHLIDILPVNDIPHNLTFNSGGNISTEKTERGENNKRE
jgi:hypothetical protein